MAVHQLLDLIIPLILLAAQKWFCLVDGTVMNFLTMFMFSISRLWLGQSQKLQVSNYDLMISGPGPSPRKGHCAVLIGNNLVIHGGFYYNEETMKKAGFKF